MKKKRIIEKSYKKQAPAMGKIDTEFTQEK